MVLTRRHFMARAAGFALGFRGLRAALDGWQGMRPPDRYGPLVEDPESIFDLPQGFSYTVVSRAGDPMTDGLVVPARCDGMAAFPGEAGLTILVRNHEIEHANKKPGAFGPDNALFGSVPRTSLFDAGLGARPSLGGVTTVHYDTREKKVVRQFLSLAGTERNCAGGPTPRGTWITCEESQVRAGKGYEKDHGWAFEIPAAGSGLVEPKPILGMGRFYREACCTDPRTGIVYQSEDLPDGLMYRYVPERPADLHAGGRLEALAVVGRPSLDTGNRKEVVIRPGERVQCSWVPMRDVHSPGDDLRLRGHADGAARIWRAEGMWWAGDRSGGGAGGCAYFCCTEGGPAGRGQIFRYTPGEGEGTPGEKPGTLELFVEAAADGVLKNPDNVTAAPWGDLIVCEDGNGQDELLGVTPSGDVYRLGRNRKSTGELAGCCFSPDGTTLFLNMQEEGLTLAITGPWG